MAGPPAGQLAVPTQVRQGQSAMARAPPPSASHRLALLTRQPLPAPACLRRPTTKKLDLKTTEAPDPAGASDRAGDRGSNRRRPTWETQRWRARAEGWRGAVGDPVRTLSSVTGAG